MALFRSLSGRLLSLTILVVMGNAGLAERGDARIYFGKAVDENPEEFGRLTGLAKTKGLEGALDRRDASIRAYRGLLELWEKDREAYFAELERFIGAHLEAMSEKKVSLREAVEAGPVSWGRRSTARLDLLPEGREKLTPVLFVPGRDTAFGMCGILRPVTGLQEVDKRPHP